MARTKRNQKGGAQDEAQDIIDRSRPETPKTLVKSDGQDEKNGSSVGQKVRIHMHAVQIIIW